MHFFFLHLFLFSFFFVCFRQFNTLGFFPDFFFFNRFSCTLLFLLCGSCHIAIINVSLTNTTIFNVFLYRKTKFKKKKKKANLTRTFLSFGFLKLDLLGFFFSFFATIVKQLLDFCSCFLVFFLFFFAYFCISISQEILAVN